MAAILLSSIHAGTGTLKADFLKSHSKKKKKKKHISTESCVTYMNGVIGDINVQRCAQVSWHFLLFFAQRCACPSWFVQSLCFETPETFHRVAKRHWTVHWCHPVYTLQWTENQNSALNSLWKAIQTTSRKTRTQQHLLEDALVTQDLCPNLDWCLCHWVSGWCLHPRVFKKDMLILNEVK